MALLAVASENTAIAAVFVPSTTYYLSLHSATPGQTGASEISGGSYARQALTFGSATNGVELSTNSQTFTNLPVEASGIPYFGVWSTASGGTRSRARRRTRPAAAARSTTSPRNSHSVICDILNSA